MAHHEREDPLRVDEGALAVARADAVGVAVGREAGVEALPLDDLAHRIDVRRDGLGVQVAEAGIGLAVNLDDLDAHMVEDRRQV